MKVDVCAKISGEQERKDLCERIGNLTGQGWANFNGRVHATYVGEVEEIAQELIRIFDNLPEHEITFRRGYPT